jgi:hypothetical protein
MKGQDCRGIPPKAGRVWLDFIEGARIFLTICRCSGSSDRFLVRDQESNLLRMTAQAKTEIGSYFGRVPKWERGTNRRVSGTVMLRYSEASTSIVERRRSFATLRMTVAETRRFFRRSHVVATGEEVHPLRVGNLLRECAKLLRVLQGGRALPLRQRRHKGAAGVSAEDRR